LHLKKPATYVKLGMLDIKDTDDISLGVDRRIGDPSGIADRWVDGDN
jgi:hypothetical protein